VNPQPGYIANRNLTLDQVPDLLVESLDLSDRVTGGRIPDEWEALWTFALTYDGYAYFGGDNGAAQRLNHLADSVKQAFLTASDGTMDEPSARYPSYLLRAIRADITG